MVSISEIVAKTEAMINLLNEHFYQNELIRPAITVSSDNGRGAYGWCSIYEIWQSSGEAHREINITAEYINRPIGEVAAIMLHEMAHLYNLMYIFRSCPLFLSLNKQGKTVIIATHDDALAKRCDRIIRIHDGLWRNKVCHVTQRPFL